VFSGVGLASAELDEVAIPVIFSALPDGFPQPPNNRALVTAVAQRTCFFIA
jgi:hypothetical protein